MSLEGVAVRVGRDVVGIGAGVPIGVSAAVLIGGTNDMATNQKMGCRWEVTDPDGQLADSYEDWEAFWTGPGLEHGFVGNQFSIDKPGNWNIIVELLMNPDAPVIVDSYVGLLCVVTEVFAGSITRKELDYDAVRVPFPLS